LAFGLTSSRLVTILAFVPIFTELPLPMSMRFASALALSAPLLPMVDSTLVGISPEPWVILLLVAKEALIGVILLLIIGLPFWAVDMAGDIIEFQRGMGNEGLTDPNDLVQSQPTGRLLFLVFLLFVIASGGLTVIMRLIYDSYVIVPIADYPDITQLIASLLRSEFFNSLFDYALLITLPMLLILSLTDLSVAFLSRFAQQLNILTLSLVIKGLITVVGLAIYAPLLHSVTEPLLIDVVARFRSLWP